MATELRAFAAVWVGQRGGQHIVPSTVRHYESEARKAAADMWVGGWKGAMKQGWRIRPVIIRLEE